MNTEPPAKDAKCSDEYETFTKTLGKVLSVSHTEIKRREIEYKKEAAKNPNRRGPKRKVST